ncbi:unnamed protein product [Amaranthus hypochondriacus]
MEISGLFTLSPNTPRRVSLFRESLSRRRVFSDKRKYFEYVNRNQYRKRNSVTVCKRSGNDKEFGSGRIVDEDMIELRLRIRELKLIEKGEEICVPSNWYEWEKKHYKDIQRSVYEIIGNLQIFLTNCRPRLALGIIAFVVLSVLFSSGLLITHSIEIIEGIMSQFSSL